MAKKGLLARKVEGSINAEQKFEKPRLKEKKKNFRNQQITMKVSKDTKRDMEAIKSLHKIKFDYEVIQLLIDSYSDTLSDEERRRYNLLRDNL